jgi:hypothetical protein
LSVSALTAGGIVHLSATAGGQPSVTVFLTAGCSSLYTTNLGMSALVQTLEEIRNRWADHGDAARYTQK